MKKTITIRIKANKNGKPVAHYWGLARRWLPISVDKAELALATGTLFGCPAVANETTSDPLPAGYVQTSIDGDVWSA
jgi:hypothetical protein